VNWDSCLEFLRQRLGFLEAVVFSGGEPTAQEGLLPAIAQVRDLGFAIGLHTAGMFPDRLERVLPLVDWVGFDVKAPFDARYEQITGRRDSARRARQSLEILQRASVPFQVRTTVDESVLNEDALLVVDEDLKGRGLPPTVRQTCRERSG
jgi:pyruvate formate lyase activating enzyme